MIKKPKKEQLLIGVLTGLLLAVIAVPLPDTKKKEAARAEKQPVKAADDTEKRLAEILKKISGVGAVEVFMTYADNGRVVVEKDGTQSENMLRETDSSGGSRTTTSTEDRQETVLGSSREPYVVQQLRPQVEGVLVVAEGAGNEAVKMRIKETIKALFGLEANKISIMRMEVSR